MYLESVEAFYWVYIEKGFNKGAAIRRAEEQTDLVFKKCKK
jgi:hypothetical protein